MDELVLFVHSIYKLRGFELVQGQNEFGDLSAFSLTNMKIYRKGNKKDQFLDVNEETMPSFGSDILDIIDVINLVVNKNPKKDVVPRVNARDTIFINYKSRKWHMDKHLKYDVKSCALLNYNAITFVSDEDYELMKKIEKSIFIQITVLIYENANLPYTHLTSRRIYEELEGEYLEIFTDTEAYLYDADAIIELMTNISHVAMCTKIQTEVRCGIMEGLDNILEVKFTIKGFYDENGCLEEFMYPLRNSQLDKRDNFNNFANFIHLLIINHERKRKKC